MKTLIVSLSFAGLSLLMALTSSLLPPGDAKLALALGAIVVLVPAIVCYVLSFADTREEL